MDKKTRERVSRNFLITRRTSDYLSICGIMEKSGRSVTELH